MAIRRNQRTRTRGFTLVEMLATIAIIGLLAGLLIPAVQGVRESARRASCLHNMTQVAKALHVHHHVQGTFPYGTFDMVNFAVTGRPGLNRCWMHEALPYLEQMSLFNQVQEYWGTNGRNLGLTGPTGFAGNRQVVPSLVCASDANSPKIGALSHDGTFSGNVVVCAGNQMYAEGAWPWMASTRRNGVFFSKSRVTLESVSDGTSNTAMLSETVMQPDVTSDFDVKGRYYSSVDGGVLFSTYQRLPNDPRDDILRQCVDQYPGPANNRSAQLKNAPCAPPGHIAWYHNTARSYHPGGVNFGMADGSVRFMADNVSSAIYTALGSRDQGDLIDGEF